MASIDRILQIHQSFTQEKISALNKELLKAQYAQSEQLKDIEKQLEKSNSLNRRMIELQKQEIQERETQKFYKHLSFQINEMITFISNQKENNIKCFLLKTFSPFVKASLNSTIEILTEINDKSYCRDLVNKFSEIEEAAYSINSDYENTLFNKIIEYEKDYEKQKEENTYKIIQLQNKKIEPNLQEQKIKKVASKKTLIVLSIITIISILFPPLFLILLSITLVMYFKQKKWRQNYRNQLAIRNQIRDSKKYTKETIAEEIEILEKQLEKHEYIDSKQKLINQFPDWETIFEQTESFIPKLKQSGQKKYDSLLEEAAKLILKNNQGSTSLIQRKLSLGYNRAGKIMEQLEELKIVGGFNGSQPRQILISSEEQLDKIFTLLKNKK